MEITAADVEQVLAKIARDKQISMEELQSGVQTMLEEAMKHPSVQVLPGCQIPEKGSQKEHPPESGEMVQTKGDSRKKVHKREVTQLLAEICSKATALSLDGDTPFEMRKK